MPEGCVKTLCNRSIFGRVAVILEVLALVFGYYLVVGRGFLEEGGRDNLAERQGVTVFCKPKCVVVWAITSAGEHSDFEPIPTILKVAYLLEAGNLQGREGKERGVDGFLFLAGACHHRHGHGPLL